MASKDTRLDNKELSDIPVLGGGKSGQITIKPKAKKTQRKPLITRRQAVSEANIGDWRGYTLHPLDYYIPILEAVSGGMTATKAIEGDTNPYKISRKDFFLAVNDKSQNSLKKLTDLYDAACAARADYMADSLQDRMTDDSKDIIKEPVYNKDGEEVGFKTIVNGNATRRDDLIMRNTQWSASLMNRRRFAQKTEVQVEVTIRTQLQQALKRVGDTYDNDE